MKLDRGKYIVVVISVLLLAACSGTADTDNGAADTDNGAAPSGTAGTDNGAAPSGEPLAIGLLVPLSGGATEAAQMAANLTQMAVDEINEDGGVNGRPLELHTYDSQLQPETAAQEARRAITRDGVVALIGAWSSAESAAAAEVAEREGVPQILNASFTDSLTEDKDFIFRTTGTISAVASGMATLAEAKGATNAVLMHDSGTFGQASSEVLPPAFAETPVAMEATVEYPFEGTDMSAQVATAARSEPDAVVISGSVAADHGLIVSSMVEQGLNVPVFGFTPIAESDAARVSGGAYDEVPVYALLLIDERKEAYQDLLSRYTELHEEVPSLVQAAVSAYDAANIIAEGLAATDGEGGEALATALEEMEPYSGVGGRPDCTMSFTDGDHDGYEGTFFTPYLVDGTATLTQDIELTESTDGMC